VTHDDYKAWARDYQRITPTCDKRVDTDAAYDAHLAHTRAVCEATLAAEDALFAAPDTTPSAALTLPAGAMFRRQA